MSKLSYQKVPLTLTEGYIKVMSLTGLATSSTCVYLARLFGSFPLSCVKVIVCWLSMEKVWRVPLISRQSRFSETLGR